MTSQRELLSEAEHDRIYASEIRRFFLDAVDRSLTPTAVLVGAQPGAGKSGAIRDINARLASTWHVVRICFKARTTHSS